MAPHHRSVLSHRRTALLVSWATILGACSPGAPQGKDLDGGTTVRDAGFAACTVGQNQTCADEPTAVGPSICNADGTCTCGAEYTMNPATGRCRWGACSPLRQDCAPPSDGCFPPSTGTGFQCLPAGTAADGTTCASDSDCLKGSTCYAGAPSVCRKLCDLDGGISAPCAGGLLCQSRWARAGMPGICVP